MPRTAILSLLALTLGMLALIGCAGTLAVPEQRPPDYALVVTVFPVEGSAAPFRPARYALEPDGLLRAEVGGGGTQPAYPPIARRLEPAQIDTLYSHTKSLDLDQEDTPAVPVPGPQVYEPPAGEPVALVEIAALGIARAFEIDTADPAAITLIRELERLTWQDR